MKAPTPIAEGLLAFVRTCLDQTGHAPTELHLPSTLFGTLWRELHGLAPRRWVVGYVGEMPTPEAIEREEVELPSLMFTTAYGQVRIVRSL